MSPEDVALFDAAHDRLIALKSTSDVQDLVRQLVSGLIGFHVFVTKLFALPAVQSALAAVNNGVAAGVGSVVAGATPPPFGLVTGPVAGAAAKFVAGALEHYLAGVSS
jgi:hypothetical protein